MDTTKKLTWRWDCSNTCNLGSAVNPAARVYACSARPRRSRFVWTVVCGGHVLAVCADTTTAMKLARAWLAEVTS